MSKEMQIEEMAKVIEITEQIARDAHCGYPSPRMIASDLYDKGYREQSEVAREIFGEIEAAADYFKELKGFTAMAVSFREYVSKLKKKYTGEVEGDG